MTYIHCTVDGWMDEVNYIANMYVYDMDLVIMTDS